MRARVRGSAGLLVPGGEPGRRTVALLQGEPAGTIATRTAGAVEFEATLSWRHPEDVPPEPMLRELPAARCSISGGPQAATRRLAGELRAFSLSELASALEAALRSVTALAALTEAVLEVRAVRTAPPRVASPMAVEELARDLWSAGFRVRFGPSWEPAAAADVYVGIGEGELQGFLRSHPSWSVA